jgi:hypothetical protein
MATTRLSGLMKMELRDGRTIRLCDGGFVYADIGAGAELFLSADATFGVIGSMDAFSEGVDEEVPAFKLTFNPNSVAAAAELSAPGMQGSVTTFWIVELHPDTDLPISTPQLMFEGQIDKTVLRIGRGKRELDIEFISSAARLLAANEGNSLNPIFHKSVYPGELGEDNATGLGISVAWGAEAQRTSGYSYSGGGSISGFGGGSNLSYV